MTTTLNDALAYAQELGYEHGNASGSWVEFRSEASARSFIAGYEDGDPEVMDMEPSPLSGEFAGEPTPKSILEECDYEESRPGADSVLSTYEQSFHDAWWQEALKTARAALPG